MKTLLALLIFMFAVTRAKTQLVDFYGHKFQVDICDSAGTGNDNSAKESLDKICDAADVPDNFVLVPCANIDNCFAMAKKEILYIVYDENFFSKVKTFGFTTKNLPGASDVDWVALTILAHELGHHVCQHTTSRIVREKFTPIEMELQADEFAGTVMFKLGATLVQAQAAMRGRLVSDEATPSHPARKDRLAAVAKGWNKENDKAFKNPPPIHPAADVPTQQVASSTTQPDAPTPVQPVANTTVQPINPPVKPVTKPVVQPATKPVTQPAASNPMPFRPGTIVNKDTTARSGPKPIISLPGMVVVIGGTFNMGSAYPGDYNAQPVHSVTVGNFNMAKYEITVAQYKNFIDATGYKTSAEIDGWSYALQGGILLRKNGVDWRCGVDGEVLQKSEMNRPVTHVSYNDAVSFCVWLNQQTGKNYRLPTEAEWEYAAKGGKRGSGFMFSGGPDPMAVGWLSQNSGHETHPVGQKPPNRLGLCDMTGNVWEWCGDWFGRYDEGQAVDPEGPATGAYRVVRGGSWHNDPQSSRVSSRNHLKPSGRSANIGFRVVSDL